MNFATVKAWLAKQTTVDWIAHGAAALIAVSFVGFQVWAMSKGQPWRPRAFGEGATGVVSSIALLLGVQHHYKQGNNS